MQQYLEELNEVQRQAVEHIDGPVMVIAGPGSGKTRVLTYKIAHLIKSGIAPWEILALTFTNKAAKEMKERIEKVVGHSAYKVWAGTFHSIFAKILRFEAHRIGYPNDFTIYDTDDSKSLINEIIKELGLDSKLYNNAAIRSRISMAKSNLITPKLYVLNEELMNHDRMNRRGMMHRIYEKYVAKCVRSGAMDFDDLLLQMYRLLYQNPDQIKEKYQQAFKYILVDEFQDTNYLQYQILKQFTNYPGSPNNVCIVGDDAQSIYSFRGATIENILQFQNDFPNVATYKLEQNYRSSKYIVEAANHIISYNRKQIKKTIWTDQDGGSKIKLIKCSSDNEEGRRVADMIIEQKNRNHIENREIAVLYRTNAQSRVFEEHLRRQNIHYRIYGGLSFYQRKEIRDVLAYMRLAVNPKDNEAFKRVVNFPRRGIGKTTIEKLISYAEDHDIPLFELIEQYDIGGRAGKLLQEFMHLIHLFGKKATELNAYDAASYIARKSGIWDMLKADTSMEGIGRLENLTALLDGIQEFIEDDVLEEGEEIRAKSLANYLQNIALLTDLDQDVTETDYITLMSAHAAKGLEFKSVFIVGLEENLFPSYMSMSSPDQIDEERRLFYVALTRAKQMVTITYCTSRYHFGQMRFNDPSRFLEELPENIIENTSNIRQVSGGSLGLGQPKLLGNFKQLEPKTVVPSIAMKDFKASPSHAIEQGMEVLHMKFGQGKVLKVDGSRDNRVATIHFSNIANPEKRIMLRFAKLQIVS